MITFGEFIREATNKYYYMKAGGQDYRRGQCFFVERACSARTSSDRSAAACCKEIPMSGKEKVVMIISRAAGFYSQPSLAP